MKAILALNGISPCGDVVKAVAARPWPSGSSFCLLNVLDPYPFVRAPLLLDRAKASVRQNLESAAGCLRGLGGSVTTEIVLGNPRRGINAFARDWQADLVIVGSNELRDWERLVLGSTARSVLLHAPCSAAIVRPARGGADADVECKRNEDPDCDRRIGVLNGCTALGGRASLASGQRGESHQRPRISSAEGVFLPQRAGGRRLGQSVRRGSRNLRCQGRRSFVGFDLKGVLECTYRKRPDVSGDFG